MEKSKMSKTVASLMFEILVSLAASDLTELHVQYRSVLLRLHFVCRKTRANDRNYQLTSLQTEWNLSPPC